MLIPMIATATVTAALLSDQAGSSGATTFGLLPAPSSTWQTGPGMCAYLLPYDADPIVAEMARVAYNVQRVDRFLPGMPLPPGRYRVFLCEGSNMPRTTRDVSLAEILEVVPGIRVTLVDTSSSSGRMWACPGVPRHAWIFEGARPTPRLMDLSGQVWSAKPPGRAPCSLPEPSYGATGGWIEARTTTEADWEISRSPLVLLVIHRPSCPMCRALEPILLRALTLGRSEFSVVRLQDTGSTLGRYDVRREGVPTLRIFRNGVLVETVSEAMLRGWLYRGVGGAYMLSAYILDRAGKHLARSLVDHPF